MIDWVTARVSIEAFSESEQAILRCYSDRVIRYDPKTGDLRYETTAWDSIRSDSHAVTVRVTGTDFWFQGSPARCIGDGDSVFSAGASKAEDLTGCVKIMAAFALSSIEISTEIPLIDWEVTRVDITRNLALGSVAEVRQALAYLRNAEGGRYRVNQPDGDTVYWNKTSRYKKAKAYAKGPHLKFQMNKNRSYEGRPYSEFEIEHASRLLRLELTIFKRYWEKLLEKRWFEITPIDLDEQWQSYFGAMLGTTIMNDEELREKIRTVAPTEGQARAAFLCWYAIKSQGWELARENHSRSSWFRNLKNLKLAGLKVVDIGNGKIIPFKVQKLVLGKQVRSWDELRQAA